MKFSMVMLRDQLIVIHHGMKLDLKFVDKNGLTFQRETLGYPY